MGRIEHIASGRRVSLWVRTRVGRSPLCELCLDQPRVSREHATFHWIGGRWVLRDLDSGNGTFLDGRRLEPGEDAPLSAGQRVGFGAPIGWRVLDCEPPRAVAVADDGRVVAFRGGALVLPHSNLPLAMVLRDAEGKWMVDRAGWVEPLGDSGWLQLDDGLWRVELPAPSTIAAGTGPPEPRLSFHHKGGRFTDLVVHQAQGSVSAGNADHWGTLMALARLRLEQQHVEEESERGWMYQTDLQRAEHISDLMAYAHICRARQELALLTGIAPYRVIERRVPKGRLRIGLADVELVDEG